MHHLSELEKCIVCKQVNSSFCDSLTKYYMVNDEHLQSPHHDRTMIYKADHYNIYIHKHIHTRVCVYVSVYYTYIQTAVPAGD